ncbi:MAG: hypothetical protein M1818_000022 [Claussenomyces sp. TS43310]|nr:MAG: hypothetical protein M1818_000022 [Claussenomyces sp. TS43310]
MAQLISPKVGGNPTTGARAVFGGKLDWWFCFPVDAQDNNSKNLVINIASYLGGQALSDLLALCHRENNGMKNAWTQAQSVTIGGFCVPMIVNIVKKSANVFQYLHNGVSNSWTAPSNSIEAVTDAFDQSIWNAGFTAQGTSLMQPTVVAAAVTH